MVNLAEWLEWGVLGLILYWLRATIDQRKGAWLELLAVTLPLALVAVVSQSAAPGQSLAELGVQITPYVVFVFLALLTVAGKRFAERLIRGEQPQITDMFRLTTITGLTTFVVRQLEVDARAMVFVTVMTAAYLTGDHIATSSTRRRRITWLVLTALVLLVIVVLERNLITSFPRRNIPIVMGLRLDVLFGLLLAPTLLHKLFDNWQALIPIGYWAEVTRHRFTKPSDGIYHRTLFQLWRFRPGVCFLNHGSFGAVPRRIERAQRNLRTAYAAEPMDMLARHLEPAWRRARDTLAFWLGASPECVALCENATMAMNELASWFPLEPGDEVLLTDHEYGAVKRIWERRTATSGATMRLVELPMPFDDPQAVVQSILAACNDRTRLVVFSHITSPTAVILPVAELCARLHERGIASCVDGPHALLQERVQLLKLDCDFYTASCHKWLCAPLGSGMIYVHSRWHDRVQPLRLSWGLLPPNRPASWTDELTWVGTRDYSPYLTLRAAIEFFSGFDYDRLDARNHALACYASRVLADALGTAPLTPQTREWMGWMAAVWLPAGDHSTLQQRLWETHRIEVPIVYFRERYLVRVSCHLYNTTNDIDLLARAISRELRQSALLATPESKSNESRSN